MRERILTWTVALGLGASVYLAAATGPIANLGGNTTLRGTVAALSVEVVDADGNQLTSFAGFEGYAEDAVASTGNTVVPPGFQRDDTAPTAECAEGDWCVGKVDGIGQLYVHNVNYDSSGTELQPLVSTTGGLSIFRSIDLDEGTGEVIKASAGQLYSLWVTNTATATRFIKIYNATSCSVGTGTPVITIGIPGNASDDVAGALGGPAGITFSTGICLGAVTGVADNDTGAPGNNDIIVNAFYK